MPISSSRKHKMRNLVATVYNTPWVLEPAKFSSICELLELRATGQQFTEEEIALRIGGLPEPERPTAQIINGVAVMPVYGTLVARANLMTNISGGSSMQMLGQQFQQLLANPDVKAIVLDVDSPGGMYAGCVELANQIYNARGTKPIVAVANSTAASGAYWIASSAEKLYAAPSSRLGSIGAMQVHSEKSQANRVAGETHTVVTSGENKGHGNPFEPLSAAARASIQRGLDDANQSFVAGVARNRGVTPQTVDDNFGRGDVFYADRAVAIGLADGVATLDQVVADLVAKTQSTSRAQGSAATYIQSGIDQPLVQGKETSIVWEQIKLALVARQFCSVTASEAEVKAALNVFLAVRGEQFTTVEAAVQTINMTQHAPGPITAVLTPLQPAGPIVAAPVAAPVANPTVAAPAPVQVSAMNAQEREQVALAERYRQRDIRSRAQLLGVEGPAIESAIERGLTVESALVEFTNHLMPTNQPINNPAAPSVDGSPVDRVHSGAVEAMFARCCANDQRGRTPEASALSVNARQFEGLSLTQVGDAVLSSRGVRIASLSPSQRIEAFLGLIGQGGPLVSFGASSYNTPGLFPNLLSALANKILDAAVPYAEATWRKWTYMMDPVSDFKPRTFIAMGASGELPLVNDGDDFTQSTVAEEASWIAVDQYGDEWKMTPRMVANDDLQGFFEMTQDKQIAAELTTNRLCVDLLTGNPNTPDANAFLSTAHGNLLASGAAPSVSQLSAMRGAMRLQTAPGAKRRLRFGPQCLLVPTTLETVSEQVCLPATMQPVTDTTVNVFRSKIEPIVEPMLDDVDSVSYYAFANPQLVRTIVVAFMKGYEKGGERRTYFNPGNQCQVFQIELRVAAAVRNWRGVVKNPGQ